VTKHWAKREKKREKGDTRAGGAEAKRRSTKKGENEGDTANTWLRTRLTGAKTPWWGRQGPEDGGK